jgi:hypothetical protein
MKKILALLALALVGAVSAFALDLGDIKGTWQDKNWDADWTFSADGSIVLTKTSTGETVFKFTDSNVKNFKPVVSTSEVGFSFTCAETQRSYKFTKPISLGVDLNMTVNPDWTSSAYTTSITLKK